MKGIVGVILAGGEGRRLGGVDKAFVILGARPLIAHAAAALRPQVDAFAISANGDANRFANLDAPVLPDAAPLGPLAGILAGLEWAATRRAAALLSIGVDQPFLPHDLATRLAPAPAVAVAGRPQHIVALWPLAARDALRSALAQGVRRVEDFAATLGMRQAAFDSSAFLNINTPDDLATATARLNSGR